MMRQNQTIGSDILEAESGSGALEADSWEWCSRNKQLEVITLQDNNWWGALEANSWK